MSTFIDQHRLCRIDFCTHNILDFYIMNGFKMEPVVMILSQHYTDMDSKSTQDNIYE